MSEKEKKALTTLKTNREYRAFDNFSLLPKPEDGTENKFIVGGRAVIFDKPTVLWEYDGIKYLEIIDSRAFDTCDMSDVIFNYNHGGKVVARLRNKTLKLNIAPGDGLYMEADLSGTAEGRALHEEIDGGYIDKMSFSFSTEESAYNTDTHTRTITKIKKLYDVSAVDIPAYEETSISARSFFEEEHSKEFRALEQAQRRKKLIAQTYL